MNHDQQPQDKFSRLHDALWEAIGSQNARFQEFPVEQPEFSPVEEGYSDAKVGDDFPVMKHLDEALKIAGEHGFKKIADAFAEVSGELPWSQNPRYTEANGGLNLLNGYAYASLSGPEGPIKCIAPRGGFYLMGPDVFYPDHNHAPREAYLVMTPGVEWRLDKGDWFQVEPGDVIYHSPWQMHAMRSAGNPVLAYAVWLEPGNRLDIQWSEDRESA